MERIRGGLITTGGRLVQLVGQRIYEWRSDSGVSKVPTRLVYLVYWIVARERHSLGTAASSSVGISKLPETLILRRNGAADLSREGRSSDFSLQDETLVTSPEMAAVLLMNHSKATENIWPFSVAKHNK